MSSQLNSIPPEHAIILIIGGGPAGSYAASVLQREGHQVVLFEAAVFPRYHIGESMLPSTRSYMRYIGLEEEFEKHGFLVKPGGSFKLTHGFRETFTDYTSLGPEFGAWNVVRSEMDNLMLLHAERQGVAVFQGTRVVKIDFEGNPSTSRPVAAYWTNKDGETGITRFDWLIDATGREGIMSTKYLKNRIMRENLRNIAVWAYWKDVQKFAAGTIRENSPYFEALTDETGWGWAIPLHDRTTSIGIVMHQNSFRAKRESFDEQGTKLSLREHYLQQLRFVPGIAALIDNSSTMVDESVKSASDFSYYATEYSGDHFRVIGDAANFIDPFFSSGIHVAFTGAFSAAITISASMKGQVNEKIAQEWHDAKVASAHTRFLFVVLAAYKQMQVQDVKVLRPDDIQSDDFDYAFEMFRPVIFGLADNQDTSMSTRVQKMMEIFADIFNPGVYEKDIRSVLERYGKHVVDPRLPVLGEDKITGIVGQDENARKIIHHFNALKVMSEDFTPSTIGRQSLLGYIVNAEKGKLGLEKIFESSSAM